MMCSRGRDQSPAALSLLSIGNTDSHHQATGLGISYNNTGGRQVTQEEKLVQIEILHTRFLQSESEYFMKVGLQLEHHQNSIIAKNMLVIVHHTLHCRVVC